MEKLVKKILNCSIKDIDKISFPINEQFGLIIHSDNIKYEFIIHVKHNCNKLLVIGSGALSVPESEEFLNRPVFHRISWNEMFKHSTLYYNDPTRYIKGVERGGWGLGSLDNWYIKEISKIIKIIANKIYNYQPSQLPYGNILIYGSSMGGFTALQLAILIKNSFCIVEIPQFDLTKWFYWPTLHKYIFNNLPMEIINKNYLHRINIMELIKYENYIPNAYLILDCSSEQDFEGQYKTFFCRLNELPYEENRNINKIKIRIDGKNRGHYQIPYNDVRNSINKVTYLMNKSHDDFIKGRIDLKNYGSEENAIKILYCSDKENISSFPNWFKDQEGQGNCNLSFKEKLDLEFKCIKKGHLKIFLRGEDFTKDSKIIPHVNFYKLIVNNDIILNRSVIVHHNTPFIYEKDVEDGEIIKIHVEWKPVSNIIY